MESRLWSQSSLEVLIPEVLNPEVFFISVEFWVLGVEFRF
jgi:hypothetical protein